jgi:hypothetical protein
MNARDTDHTAPGNQPSYQQGTGSAPDGTPGWQAAHFAQLGVAELPIDEASDRGATLLAPETPLGALGLRPSAKIRLNEFNIHTLGDCAQASEEELMLLPQVGRATVKRIQAHLKAIGLSFSSKESANQFRAACGRGRMARAKSAEERRRDLTDRSHVADLGLQTRTIAQLLRSDIESVGQLRLLTVRQLWRIFGKQSLREVMRALSDVGIVLESNPTQLEMWRHNAIAKEDLVHPDDSAPIRELMPWLGGLTAHCEKAGIESVGQLRILAALGGTKVPGVGRRSWERAAKYFGARTLRSSGTC